MGKLTRADEFKVMTALIAEYPDGCTLPGAEVGATLQSKYGLLGVSPKMLTQLFKDAGLTWSPPMRQVLSSAEEDKLKELMRGKILYVADREFVLAEVRNENPDQEVRSTTLKGLIREAS